MVYKDGVDEPWGSDGCIQQMLCSWPYHTFDAFRPSPKSSSSLGARGFWKRLRGARGVGCMPRKMRTCIMVE